MVGFSTTILESSKELSAKERIAVKDTTTCTSLEECNGVRIAPMYWVRLSVHNDHSKDQKDYEKFVVVATDGSRYVTGSQSFISAFMDIWNEMATEDEEYEVEVALIESKNYKGKKFITCNIVA